MHPTTNATATAIPIYIFFKIAPPLIKYVNLSILCIKLYFYWIHFNKEDEIMNILQKISLILTIIGAINWGLIGLFNFNLVDSLFGVDSFLSMLNLYFSRNCRSY